MSRGRKEGSLSGKRPIFWNCIAIKDHEIIHEEIWSEPGASQEDLNNFTADVAAAKFEESHGIKPKIVTGPCNYVKSLMKNTSTTKVLAQSKEDYQIKSVIGTAIYNGWSGIACEIESNDSVLFIASQRVDNNINKILPQSMPVKKDLLQFT